MPCFVGGTVAAPMAPAAQPELPFPTLHASFVSPNLPSPSPSSPDSSSDILADEIEREDDFEVFDTLPGPSRKVDLLTRLTFASQGFNPPLQPSPWTLFPRFRC